MVLSYKPLGLRDLKPKIGARVQRPKPAPTPKERSAPKRKREDKPSPEERDAKVQCKSRTSGKPQKAPVYLAIGTDFGTTSSAIAFAPSDAPFNQISVINNYHGRVETKVPSRIAYPEGNNFVTTRWGYQVKSDTMFCAWLKLHLYEDTKKDDFDHLLQQATGRGIMHLPEGKTASEVITDFLSKLWGHFLKHLKETILDTATDQTPKRICVPVPTIWSPAAREVTRQVVSQAGFDLGEKDEIIIIDESEAAALNVIRWLERSSDGDMLEEGSCIMVVDCGGGTIDSVVYKINSRRPLQLEEACPGAGANIGGTNIDRGLHALMQQHFGSAFIELPISKISATSHFMEQFEREKISYEGPAQDKQEFRLPLTIRKLNENDQNIQDHYDFEDNVVKITGTEMQGLFEPVIQKICQIIRTLASRMKETDQAATSLRLIALCGGLSCNTYILDQVKEFVEDFFKDGNVQVKVPRQPLAAVVEGAVLAAQGCSPIVCRRSRDFIGTQIHRSWDEKKHKPQDRFECPQMGARAMNQMEWLVKKGEKLKPDTKRRLKCYYVVENARSEIKKAVIDQVLYRCAEDIAPTRADDPEVEQIGVIRVDITDIARRKRAEGRRYRAYPAYIAINVDIELTTSSTKGVLEASAKIGNVKVGETTIAYTPGPAWERGLIRGPDGE